MFAHCGTTSGAVLVAARRFHRGKVRILAGVALATIGLGGCLQTAAPLSGADPADPGARVAGVGYRSTTAPYKRMRPATPAPWADPSSDAPPPKTDK